VSARPAIDGALVQPITYGDKVDLEESSRELVAFFGFAFFGVTFFDAATRPPPRGSKHPR
jgi:hypothetical protein